MNTFAGILAIVALVAAVLCFIIFLVMRGEDHWFTTLVGRLGIIAFLIFVGYYVIQKAFTL